MHVHALHAASSGTRQEIADALNAKGLHPGGAAWPGKHNSRFTALRVQYLVHTYGLRSRFDRLRKRGMLTKKEMAARLKIHEHTLVRWVEYGIIKAHAYTKNRWLYEEPKKLPKKHCSRWDPLVERAAAMRTQQAGEQDMLLEPKEVQHE